MVTRNIEKEQQFVFNSFDDYLAVKAANAKSQRSLYLDKENELKKYIDFCKGLHIKELDPNWVW